MTSTLTVWCLPFALMNPRDVPAVLSPDEQTRAARFHRNQDAHAFTCTRAALRIALGQLTGAPPATLRFKTGARGKPAVAFPAGLPIEFNVAHTDGLGVIAVRERGAVGIDVECVSVPPDRAEPVLTVLSLEEAARVPSHNDPSRIPWLLQAWTAREAFAKATGLGIAQMDLRRFETPDRAARGPTRVWLPDDPHPTEGWWLQWLDLGPRHVGALVGEGPLGQIQMRTWTWP